MPSNGQLNGAGRAAVLLLSMGEERAAEVLRHMTPREVQALGVAMTDLKRVSQDQISEVLDAFVESVRNESSLGLGNRDYLRSILTRALGPERAGTVMPEVMTGNSTRGLETLRWMAPRDIADVLAGEHPQVIALTLLQLEPESAPEVLRLLPEALRADVVLRVANMDAVHPSALAELDELLDRQLKSNPDRSVREIGGTESAAKLLSGLPKSIEKAILEHITSANPELIEKLEGLMFNFETLLGIDDRSFQTLLREVQSDTLVVALKGSSNEMKEKVFKNMSSRAADLLKDDLETKGPVRLSEVETAQREVLDVARKLADDGQLMLPGGDEDFV